MMFNGACMLKLQHGTPTPTTTILSLLSFPYSRLSFKEFVHTTK